MRLHWSVEEGVGAAELPTGWSCRVRVLTKLVEDPMIDRPRARVRQAIRVEERVGVRRRKGKRSMAVRFERVC